MRLAIISDMHGECYALDQVLQDIRRQGNSWYFNPGSVSLAYNWELTDRAHGRIRVDPWADYAIVTSERASLGLTFRHVPFDVDELARIIRASGRPYAEEAIATYSQSHLRKE